ncbi:spheroidene monooxygenase [Adhaeribacter sp. BT258]|uniref:Spheroidene monooxygenase n=1 Tax=Adhaeribacter terrigena TaxID=2793070 RepID=A0ABS1C1J5_9BACT|nr:spheroidene monooxygenase [Adhaeribacter terrigena]MBK0403042.1 spheroidene monooxygenase [Adhaeribacter terrigena]
MEPNSSSAITTITILGLKPGNIRWGLAKMGTMPLILKSVPGLKFFKMLGSGNGLGFSLKPNFNRYGLLCTWENEAAAAIFFAENQAFLNYIEHTSESWTIWLKTLQAHGLWDGLNPFSETDPAIKTDGKIAALTRATIRLKALPAFWKHVPQTSLALKQADGLLCSAGLGELPFIRQATFSVWKNAEALKNYAYKNARHKEVIKRTRDGNWYKEELFARFVPVKTEGLWNGNNPVKLVEL